MLCNGSAYKKEQWVKFQWVYLYSLNDKLGDERTIIKDDLIGIKYSPWIIFLKDPSNTTKAYQTTIRQAVSFLAR